MSFKQLTTCTKLTGSIEFCFFEMLNGLALVNLFIDNFGFDPGGFFLIMITEHIFFELF